MGPSRQFVQGFGDFICYTFRTAAPIIIRVAKTLFKSSLESLNDVISIGDFFKSALEPTLRTALKHGGKALGKVIYEQEQPTAAPPLEPLLLIHDELDAQMVKYLKSQTGVGRYKASRQRKVSNRFIGINRSNVHYNFQAIIMTAATKDMLMNYVMLFETVMQQSYLRSSFTVN